MVTGVMTLVLLASLLVWQVGDRSSRVDTVHPLAPPAGATKEQPRRFADYEGTSGSTLDQCSLPVEHRTGGWICPETK